MRDPGDEGPEPLDLLLNDLNVGSHEGGLTLSARQCGLYVEHLRPTRPVDVVAAVRKRDERYWVCKRNANGAHGGLAGLWEYPGGKVEPNEQLRPALVRELREEFPGVSPTIGAVLDSIESLTLSGTGVGDDEVRERLYRVTFFEVEMEDPTETPCHEEVGWFSPDEICRMEHLPSGTIFNARHLALLFPRKEERDRRAMEVFAEQGGKLYYVPGDDDEPWGFEYRKRDGSCSYAKTPTEAILASEGGGVVNDEFFEMAAEAMKAVGEAYASADEFVPHTPVEIVEDEYEPIPTREEAARFYMERAETAEAKLATARKVMEKVRAWWPTFDHPDPKHPKNVVMDALTKIAPPGP